jgi:hypothetical protein
MKKNLMILTLVFCLFACNKEETDYREKYAGSYAFKIDYMNMHVGRYPDALWQYETWRFSGSVSIAEGSSNRLLVHWGDGTSTGKGAYGLDFNQHDELIVDQSGNLTYPGYDDEYQSLFKSASIKNDTIRFTFVRGGAGSQYIWEVTGIKD